MRSVARSAFVALVLCGGAGACNLITGAQERTLDRDGGEFGERDAGEVDPGNEDADPNGMLDGGVPKDQNVPDTNEAGIITITVNVAGPWMSLNGATFSTVDGGKRIDTATTAGHHPVIVPVPQPFIPSDNYTVHAIIRAATSGTPSGPGPAFEFGIVARVQPNGSSLLLSSSYGTQAKPFVGQLSSLDWNPTNPVNGDTYNYVAGARYQFEMNVKDNEVRAKMWHEADPKPDASMLWGGAPYTLGRAVGFYNYNVVNAVLETMFITVP